jgi:hypothetical protein
MVEYEYRVAKLKIDPDAVTGTSTWEEELASFIHRWQTAGFEFVQLFEVGVLGHRVIFRKELEPALVPVDRPPFTFMTITPELLDSALDRLPAIAGTTS